MILHLLNRVRLINLREPLRGVHLEQKSYDLDSTLHILGGVRNLMKLTLFTIFITCSSFVSLQTTNDQVHAKWLVFNSALAQSEISIVDDRSVHVPDEYEVEDGDSLWLISQEFFNDPWLWPNLWALNPHITNPHWIYPGDIVRLKWTKQAAEEADGCDR